MTEARIRIPSSAAPTPEKSTLVNTLVGEERVVTFDQPGTRATRSTSSST